MTIDIILAHFRHTTSLFSILSIEIPNLYTYVRYGPVRSVTVRSGPHFFQVLSNPDVNQFRIVLRSSSSDNGTA